MHMHRWGSRDDVPVVFWHALGTSGADFAPVGKAIAGAGFYVLAVDGPGFGKSKALEPDAYRLDALVGLLHEQLIELDRPVLIGHSWGGAVAVRYAGAHPEDVRALVLLDSGHLDYADLHPNGVPADSSPGGMARTGLLDRVSTAWPAIAENEIPTLLLLATQPPHVEVNRAHVPRFEAALPHADVRWLDGVSHGVVEDVGAPLGEDIAAWLVEQGI